MSHVAVVTRIAFQHRGLTLSYDIIKERLLATGYFQDTAPLHLLTATLGGTIAVTACAPVDVFKSRVQASTSSGKVGTMRMHDEARGSLLTISERQ